MPCLLDAIILAVFIICIIRGAKKGFIKAAFSILTFLLAAILSFMFYVPFSEYIINTQIGQNISQNLGDSIYKAVSGELQEGENKKENQSNSPNAYLSDDAQSADSTILGDTTEGIIKSLKLPTFMFSTVFEQSDFLMRTARLNAAQAVSSSLTTAFMKLVSGIILFLLILIGLWILRLLLQLLFKLPLLNEVNKLVGVVAGLVNGFLVSYLIIAICVSLSGFNELSFIKNTMEKSYIYNNFYQTNIIAEMFLK